MKKVAIIYRTLFQYRTDFYNQLREALLKDGIELNLIYGKLDSADFKMRNDQIDIEWGKFIKNKILRLGSREIIWQPCLKDIQEMDMVIVEQANKLLLNYYLMFARNKMNLKFCFWGHGRNMQANEKGLANQFKYLYIKQCDWWFAYTKGVKQFLIEKGYTENKITAVQNAIDTRELKKQYGEVSTQKVSALREELGIFSDKVGIYCGAMYSEKRMGFILESCQKIKAAIPDFHMIFIGSGLDAGKVESVAQSYDWIHYVGPKFGQDRVKYFKLARIQLMPGAVGLGVLDSFALETPLITTQQHFHGPEIDYLENGQNGVITVNDLEEYSKAAINLLLSENYKEIVGKCIQCADLYTIEKMVQNFRNGVLECLNVKEQKHSKITVSTG